MTRRVVLVVGPPLAGVSAVVAALRAHVPDVLVVDDRSTDPDAVLVVASAAAPLTRSDWALIGRAGMRTDVVIGVVSKIDAHRGWRDVMAADRALVAGWDARHRSMPWVGVAAAPGLGEVRVGELIDLLRDRLDDPGLDDRNRLWANQFRAHTPPRASDGAEARRVLQRVRLHLLRHVRDETATLRAELRDAACAVGVGGTAEFEARVASAADAFHARLSAHVTTAVDVAAAEVGVAAGSITSEHGPPDVSRTASSSRRLEGRLMAVLGIGFGWGIALAASRLVAGVASGSSIVGWAAGAAAGVALVVWVVRTRGLLHDRALLDRWVVEVAATLRWHGEAMVAERLLAAESHWASARVRRTPSGPPRTRVSSRLDVTDQYEWC